MAPEASQKTIGSSSIVIVGLGMVGLSFIEKILEYDTAKKYTITAICQEPLGKQYCGMLFKKVRWKGARVNFKENDWC